MATKSSQPALYEKFRNRGGAMPAPIKTDLGPASPPVISSPAEAGMDGGWLAPGRTIRVPVGYVILAAGIAVAVLAAFYTIGYRAGARHEHAKLAKELNTATTDNPGLSTVDPLANPQVLGSGGASVRGGNQGNGNANASSVRSAPPSSWGPVIPQKEPRIKGLNYFVLMETNEPGAVRLAEFCRSYGLETYVIPSKNERRKVIAFPGFDASARTSQAVKDLEAKIVSIGEKWKATEKNATGLREYYPLKFDG